MLREGVVLIRNATVVEQCPSLPGIPEVVHSTGDVAALSKYVVDRIFESNRYSALTG